MLQLARLKNKIFADISLEIKLYNYKDYVSGKDATEYFFLLILFNLYFAYSKSAAI